MVKENRCPVSAATGLKGMAKECQAFGVTDSLTLAAEWVES